jgi:sugar lactone lactonase YvrE
MAPSGKANMRHISDRLRPWSPSSSFPFSYNVILMLLHPGRSSGSLAAAIAALILQAGGIARAQPAAEPNSQPNPYRTIENWAKLPEGRAFGSNSGIDLDRKGNIWVAERCGANSCAGKTEAPVCQFDSSGKMLKCFGEGMFVFPHGLTVDQDGNIWVTDGQGKDDKGHQVFKFSPEGKLLMALGKAGVAGDGQDTFNQPNAVAVAPNGDIFISDGHSVGRGNARVVKFTKDGKFIKQWGGHGSEPGQFEMPHALAFDSKGRLFVADRGNNRIQIFDQDGKFLAEWKQFSRPSGIFIDKGDNLYVADSESTDREGYGHNPGWKRGIRVGSAKDGTVTAFIPDPSPGTGATSSAEGVAADAQGNIFGAEVREKDVKKYVKK